MKDPAIQKTVEILSKQKKQQALANLDHPSLHAATSIISQVGFQHFNLSLDTRLNLEARKAHRFVAANCEDIAKKVLGLTGASPEEVQAMLYQIGEQIKKFQEAQAKGASMHPVAEGLKQ